MFGSQHYYQIRIVYTYLYIKKKIIIVMFCYYYSECVVSPQVQLQNLMSSKHVAHFMDRITDWVRKMSRVESVIGAWVDVQRAWSQMEVISQN